MTMTPDKFRDVAWALDALSKVSRSLLEPIAAMDEIKADDIEVTIKVTRDGEPLTPEEAQTILGWLDGDEMQEDLRTEARKLDELAKVRPAAPGDMSINERVAWREGWAEGYLAQPQMDTGEEEK